MSREGYQVKEVSELSGVTVRALHHYDAIGLVCPSGRSEAGYRLYGDSDLLRLQQVLLLRELGLPLERIRRMLDEPGLDRKALLREHRERLAAERDRTETRLRAVEAAIVALEEEETMNPREIFDGFDPADYEAEAEERWGHSEAFRESSRRTKRYTKTDWETIQSEDRELMGKIAAVLGDGTAPDSDDAVALAEAHRLHIDRWFYPCSKALHAGLGEMYVSDERFRASLDAHGDGVAEFLSQAIRANAERG